MLTEWVQGELFEVERYIAKTANKSWRCITHCKAGSDQLDQFSPPTEE